MDSEELQRIERAHGLELERIERAQKLAVEQAVRDALVDRTLEEHTRHLEQINGSQSAMARSLNAQEKLLEKLTISSGAVADYVEKQSDHRFSKRTLWIAAIAATAPWLALGASLLVAVLG